MVKCVDLKRFNFECVRCGNCCYNVLRKMESGDHGYNFRGEFRYNPLSSVSILYTEIPELRENLYNHYKMELDIHPQHVFFMKEFPIGFIFQYQLGVKKKKYCRYYDIQKRICKIYPIRPSTCREYPLSMNPNNLTFPSIELTCTGIIKEIKKQFPDLKEGEPSHFNSLDIFGVFLTEALTYQMMHFYRVSQLEILKLDLGDLFLDSREITPQRIESHELVDFGEFFTWAFNNITNKKNLEAVRGAKHKFEQLQIETAQNLLSWRNNPDSIKIPIKIFDSK